MKKNTIKAFTLVEMLIVIVIIGILIASLMPRMQSAQGRARDVARKNDLAQIQTAIITSNQDRGEWPKTKEGATSGLSVSAIAQELLRAGMSAVPSDPNKSNTVSGLGSPTSGYDAGQYAYMVATRNGVTNGGFVLMAKTEVEGGSNWVKCDNATDLTGGLIQDVDLRDITTCSTFNLGDDCYTMSGTDQSECGYKSINDLRYILLY